jgi:PilZ domain
MAKNAEYNGYAIQSVPQYETNWAKWRIRIFISSQDRQNGRAREFSSHVLYASEQEADVHGMTFGQRLIEGKVKGQSIVETQIPNRRATPRLRVQFRTGFSDGTTLEGIGIMQDLSMGGCRIESPVAMTPGLALELRIHVPDLEWPLMIEAASVQWVSGLVFGLAFFRITESEQQRLAHVITKVTEEKP